MLEMSDFDIYLDYKNSKRPEEQIKILAELNATTPEVIREIINKKIKEEQEMSQTKERTPEQKARKAAYMKEYWARKKAEKAAAEGVITDIPTKTEPDVKVENNTDDGLIRKAIQYYSADLADAVMMQRERVEEEQEKLRQMEADLKRCQEILGYEPEVEEGEG